MNRLGEGTPLQTDSPEYLTTRELAALLRIKERKVYDLAAAGDVPCTRVTGKLLFPEREVRAWMADSQQGVSLAPARPVVLLGSHDPLLEWSLRESGSGIATWFDGSLDGVDRFVRGEGVACSLHVPGASGEPWNVALAARTCSNSNTVLLHFARRERGLLVRQDTGITSLQNVSGLKLVQRQPQAGAQLVLQQVLSELGLEALLSQPGTVARSESDAALAVARGEGDVTLGLRSMSKAYALEFIPVVEEDFEVLIDRQAYFDAPLQTWWSFLQGNLFQERAGSLSGYDISKLGSIRWNG